MQVPKRDAGADRPIVVKKSGNADGAKGANHSAKRRGQPKREEPRRLGKSYEIPKRAVWEAYKRVKANRGAAGVDGQSLAAFEVDLQGNLYKIWNRMSSGSYFPPAVRLVEIPKQSGGTRPLGIPTVADRIAQAVVKEHLEREVEPKFHPSSYGARPGRSAHDALGKTRQRCWQKDWVIDLDVQDFFGSLPHDLVMRAVKHHCSERWVSLYVERWLKAPVQDGAGVLRTPTQGTPQGGVISPLLANLFMHYAFDVWMQRHAGHIEFERYLDDVVIHCSSEAEAKRLLVDVRNRLAECGLVLHPTKTCIAYCKDANRNKRYRHTSFDFLGYTFRSRLSRNRWGTTFVGFTPAISASSALRIREEIRSWQLPRRWVGRSLNEVAAFVNPRVRGWMNYYGRYNRSECKRILLHLNRVLARWAARKFKRFHRRKRKASAWLETVARRSPTLFVLWAAGATPRTAGW